MTRPCPLCRRDVPDDAGFCPYDGTEIDDRPTFRRLNARDTSKTGAVLGGRYRIEGFVDKGATARVYLARDLVEERKVAVKLFAPLTKEHEGIRARFLREAEAARRIDHPHVVRFYDAGVTEAGAPYLVMEALRGAPLGKVLARAGRLTPAVGLRLVREAAAGLAAAHRVGVIHRDVKPDNLFLVHEKEQGEPEDAWVKLIDFGMARDERAPSGAHELLAGTVEYMAPEQIVTEAIDARTDVYGLGMVMYRVITGHLPFEAKSGPDLLAHQLASAAPPPSWLEEGLDPAIDRVIGSAIRKRPENRYPSMDALLDDLERASPEGAPMGATHDRFEPTTTRGREVFELLAARVTRS